MRLFSLKTKKVFFCPESRMAEDQRLDCRGIASKCAMRELVLALLNWRASSGLLCSLGPAIFEPAEDFLVRVQNETPRTHLIPESSDLVAFADVHGDFLALLSHLYFAKVIDARGNWVGGDTWVCSTGDWVDRAGRDGATVDTSHNPREEVDIMQYVHALNLSAQMEGGGVLFTVGNHELYRVKAASEDAADQGHHIGDQCLGWVKKGQAVKHINTLWKPGGLMAKYLARNSPAMAKFGGVLLMHGGLESRRATPGVDVLVNRCACLYFKGLRPWHEEGLLQHVTMTRALSMGKCPQEDVDATLAITGCTQLVVGHTVQSEGESPDVCGGKVWRLDFGMSEAFGQKGSVHVLVMTAGGQEACFLSSHSVFDGKKTETRTDHCITYENGILKSKQTQMIDRRVRRPEKAFV